MERTPPRPNHQRVMRWGTVRTTVATMIRAPSDRVMALYLDWERCPLLFPATIAGVHLERCDATSMTVIVDHRREGQVRNDVSIVAAGVVELREEKPRYSATFLNRFDDVGEGTRYAIEAEVRLRWPWALLALLAPLLRPLVNRALRRFTLEPVRRAAEQRGDTMRSGSV